MRFVISKNLGSPSITTHRVSMPIPRVYASSVWSISATPPPAAVEFTLMTARPSSSSRADPRGRVERGHPLGADHGLEACRVESADVDLAQDNGPGRPAFRESRVRHPVHATTRNATPPSFVGVHLVDEVGVLVVDDVALDLQRRSHLAACDGELVGEDPVLAHVLDPRPAGC